MALDLASLLPGTKAVTPDLVKAGATATAPTAPDTSKWGYDPVYENAVNTINSGLAGLQSTKDLANNRAETDYGTSVDAAKKQNETDMSGSQNRLANQGIGYSGINVSEQGRLLGNLQTQIGSLAQAKQRTQEDAARDFATRQTDYQNQLGAAQADRATRETARETQQASDEAQANAAKTTADANRQWISDLTAKITSAVQPVATPTGKMALPPSNPQAVVQNALKAVPPPAAKTPQQQATEAGIDPKQLQTLLTQHGFSPGPIDGVMGIKTQQALARWKQSMGLPATADINQDILTQLLHPMPAGLGGTIAHRGGNQE